LPIPVILVTADPKPIHIQMDADARLAAGAGGAVRYFAEAAGLASKAAGDFQHATVAACEEAFSRVTPAHPQVDVTLAQYEDRIEVALSQEGDVAPAAGVESPAAGPASALQGADRVEYAREGSVSITRLTKYLSPHP
jgi:hypothetical protein